MSDKDWQRFKPFAMAVARTRGAVIVDRDDRLEFTNPRSGEQISVSAFDGAESIMIHAGWGLCAVIDIVETHMAEFALAELTAIFDGGAVEYLAVIRGIPVAVGHDIVHRDGSSRSRHGVARFGWNYRNAVARPLPPWS